MNLQEKTTLLTQVSELINTYISDIHTWKRGVLNFSLPQEVSKKIDFDIDDEGKSMEEMISSFSQVLNHSVATQHPMFFNQLYAAADPYGIAAEYITAVLNTSMYTYEVGPLFTMMEAYVFEQIAQMIWRKEHRGMMLPGGSTSNLYALQFARHKVAPEIRQAGMYAQKKFAIYTSDQAHYSISKSAMLMWIWLDALIKIKTDVHGSMDIQDLETQIIASQEKGMTPMMINATSGTTVLWSYDPLYEISQLAQKYDIWMHVDGIRWGTVMFHPNLKEKIAWLELADSYSRNPHKMMWVPLQGSVFMTKQEDVAWSCNVLKAPYLFQDERWYDSIYDTGDLYIQCGRRVDILKFRSTRKAHGTAGIADRVELAFENAAYLKKQIESSDYLYMAHDPQCTNVCFWYIPSYIDKDKLRPKDIGEHYSEIHAINARIKEYMLKEWKMMIGIAHLPSKGLPYFFRMVLINPEVTRDHLDQVVSYIQEVWKKLEKRQKTK